MNEYEMWKKVTEDFQETVERLEREVVVNHVLLNAAKEKLSKCKKPKTQKNPIVN